MKNAVLLTLAVLVLSLSACKAEEWKGFAFMNKDNPTNYTRIGNYRSADECRKALQKYLNDNNAADQGSYECGLNCKFTGDNQPYVCEKTVR